MSDAKMEASLRTLVLDCMKRLDALESRVADALDAEGFRPAAEPPRCRTCGQVLP